MGVIMLSYFFFLICLLLPNENSKTITYPLPGFEPDRIRKANVKSLKINFFRSEYDSTLKKDTFDFVLSRQLNFDRNGNIIFCDGFMDDFWPSERQYFNFLYLEKGDYSCASYDSKGRLVEKCDINFGHDFPLYEWKVYLYDDCNNPVIVNTSDFGKPFKTDYSYYYYDNECNILEANTMLGEGSVYSSQYLYDNNC
jgi:hypothetical protein